MTVQAQQALNMANRTRAEMARLRSEVRDLGAARAVEVLRSPCEIGGRMRVNDLLAAVPRLGQARVDAILEGANIGVSRWRRRVRELTLRERMALAWLVEAHGERRLSVVDGVAYVRDQSRKRASKDGGRGPATAVGGGL